MASKKLDRGEVLAAFFDEGVYTELFAAGTVSAAFGSAHGKPVYAVFQNGQALTVTDVDRTIHALRLAAETGNPVVTFYDSPGSRLDEGLEVLKASKEIITMISELSGVVPQIAVVLGVCGGTSALAAASSDICIMSREGELFFTSPFTSAALGDKLENAGSADFAVQAGVASLVADDAAGAAELAAQVAALMPANNLARSAGFQFEAPVEPFPAKYNPAAAAASLADQGSMLTLFDDFGPSVVTALATIEGNAAGIVATGNRLCRNCAAKISRFVRLCDAFSIPVVTVVACEEGFPKSSSEDMAGGIRAAARLAGTYADATTSSVVVVAGKAIGPVYTALSDADLTIAMQGCTISAVEPEVAAAVLYKDELDASDNVAQAAAVKAARYAAEQCSANAALAAGIADFTADRNTVRSTVVAALDMIATKRTQRLPKKHGNMAL